MRNTLRIPAALQSFLLAVPLLSGCAGLGWEDVLSGVPLGGDVRGEVEWVDERRREIGVASGWGGSERVDYDSRTRVIYRQREYRVRDLERGDRVNIDVDSNSRGRRYARVVRVERSVRDEDGRSREHRRQRFDGRVAWIDHDRRAFGLEAGRYDYTVIVPSRANRETVRRFDRLRRGARTRFEGEDNGRGSVLLVRFR